MVSSPSAAAQAAENDRKRKPMHSMEKAKANHLTRQLQMRLQYARLKVEHGWQKQNLNEVENLYFHNSHLRGAKPTSISTQPIMMTQPLQPPSTSSSILSFLAPPTQLPNIGSIQSASLINTPTSAAVSEPENPKQEIPQVLQTSVAAATSPAVISDASINADHSPDDSMQVDNSAKTITPSILPEVQTSLPPIVHDPIPAIPTISIPTSTLSLVSPQSPTSITNPSSSTNHYAALKIPRTRNNKHPAGPKGAHQNLTAKEMMDFTSTSTLTYDSFWSTHSASAPSSRSPRPVLTPGTEGAGLPPVFNSALFTNGFSTIDLSHFINLSFNPASTTVPTSVEHSRNPS